MKLNIIAVYIFLSTTLFVNAEATNKLYFPDDNSLTIWVGAAATNHRKQSIAEAATNREAMPAKDFPEGNWGEPFHGLQISLRFDKDAYTNHEPIAAVILLRNITNCYVSWASKAAFGAIDLTATSEGGRKIDPRSTLPSPPGGPVVMLGGTHGSIAPGTQMKFREILNDKYDLTNGTYLIQASLPFPLVKRWTSEGKPLELEWKQVTSAQVPIKIINSP